MKPFTKIASVIFGVIAILHLLRFIFHVEIMIGTCHIPSWASILGIIGTAILSIGLWKEAKGRKSRE